MANRGKFNQSHFGGEARIERTPAVLGAHNFKGTLRSSLEKRLGLARQISWPGASATTHEIDSIRGDTLVKTENVQFNFTWNLGYIGGIARSGGVARAYENRLRRATVIPAGREVEYIMEKSNFRLLSVQFEPRFLLRSCELEHLQDIEIIETWDYDDPLSWELAKVIYKECADEAPQGFLYSETAMTLLAQRVSRNVSTRDSTADIIDRGGLSPALLRRACDYMMERMSYDISLREVAALIDISAGHFAFAFKRSLGITPHAWLRRQRINQARSLLRDPALSLTTIALSVGYANQSAFGVAFKRETGRTPADFRRAC